MLMSEESLLSSKVVEEEDDDEEAPYHHLLPIAGDVREIEQTAEHIQQGDAQDRRHQAPHAALENTETAEQDAGEDLQRQRAAEEGRRRGELSNFHHAREGRAGRAEEEQRKADAPGMDSGPLGGRRAATRGPDVSPRARTPDEEPCRGVGSQDDEEGCGNWACIDSLERAKLPRR